MSNKLIITLFVIVLVIQSCALKDKPSFKKVNIPESPVSLLFATPYGGSRLRINQESTEKKILERFVTAVNQSKQDIIYKKLNGGGNGHFILTTTRTNYSFSLFYLNSQYFLVTSSNSYINSLYGYLSLDRGYVQRLAMPSNFRKSILDALCPTESSNFKDFEAQDEQIDWARRPYFGDDNWGRVLEYQK